MIDSENITAIVLCGGAGARLGGRDKPLLSIGGKRIINLICETLERQTGTILISCSRNVAIYESIGHRVVVDRESHRGPLAGIAQSIQHVKTEWTLIVPGDVPFISDRLTEVLERDALAQGIAVPEVEGVRQNLFLLFNAELRRSLQYFSRRGGTAVKYWIDELGVNSTQVAEASCAFLNINTKQDLEHARSVVPED